MEVPASPEFFQPAPKFRLHSHQTRCANHGLPRLQTPPQTRGRRVAMQNLADAPPLFFTQAEPVFGFQPVDAGPLLFRYPDSRTHNLMRLPERHACLHQSIRHIGRQKFRSGSRI